jgi:hypothetical protein
VYFQGYERFKKAADAVKENGGTVISGQASVFGLNYHHLIGLLSEHVLCSAMGQQQQSPLSQAT